MKKNENEFSGRMTEAIKSIQDTMGLSDDEALDLLKSFYCGWKRQYAKDRIKDCVESLETNHSDPEVVKYETTYLREVLERVGMLGMKQ
ncbi:MAG: hypothetical protein EHM49_01025 [Deltaproteobacteria bacterium]|nr:MAG: hypothetical protein EHM49_01025 [Deltaproteobacteria bacterium]